MENNPERKIVFAMKLGADSWDDLVIEVRQVLFELEYHRDKEASNMSTGGSPTHGGTWAYKINPNQTHDNYFAEVQQWLDEHKISEAYP